MVLFKQSAACISATVPDPHSPPQFTSNAVLQSPTHLARAQPPAARNSCCQLPIPSCSPSQHTVPATSCGQMVGRDGRQGGQGQSSSLGQLTSMALVWWRKDLQQAWARRCSTLEEWGVHMGVGHTGGGAKVFTASDTCAPYSAAVGKEESLVYASSWWWYLLQCAYRGCCKQTAGTLCAAVTAGGALLQASRCCCHAWTCWMPACRFKCLGWLLQLPSNHGAPCCGSCNPSKPHRSAASAAYGRICQRSSWAAS